MQRLAGRASIGAGGGLLVAISVIAMVAPGSQGVILHKPYNQFSSSTSYGVGLAGCGTAKTLKTPTWSIKTGVFKADGSVRAPPCKVTGNQQSYADWDGSFNFQGPFYFHSNGSHAVNISWKSAWNASYFIPSYGCILNYKAALSECYAWADLYIEVLGQVFDQTNFTQFNFGYTTLLSTSGGAENYSTRSCTPVCNVSSQNYSFGALSGSSVSSASGSLVLNMSGAYAVANYSHAYNLYFTVIILAFAEAFTLNAKTTVPLLATAQVNMAGLTNEFLVGSIAIV